jgi:nitrogen-specific signal transduction histidine kinase
MSLSERFDATRDIKVSQQDLALLLDHAPDAIGRFDRQLRHVYVNEKTAQANNRPASDFYGRTMEDLGHAPEVCALINRNLRRVFATAKEHTFELLFHGPTGPVWFQCRMAPEFAKDGTAEFVLVVSRDISEQKAAEAALLEYQTRTATAELSASLAHGIHNPLSIVVNAIYLLQQNQSLDPAARELAELAAKELERVSEISKRLLIRDPIAKTQHRL